MVANLARRTKNVWALYHYESLFGLQLECLKPGRYAFGLTYLSGCKADSLRPCWKTAVLVDVRPR